MTEIEGNSIIDKDKVIAHLIRREICLIDGLNMQPADTQVKHLLKHTRNVRRRYGIYDDDLVHIETVSKNPAQVADCDIERFLRLPENLQELIYEVSFNLYGEQVFGQLIDFQAYQRQKEL